MNLDVGSTIGDYQILQILGAGGMGKVYKVRNVISDRIEAMKVLLPDLVNEPELADRFVREIKVQASMEHPNIAALHTALRVDNQLLMLMELVEGVTLDQRLAQGPLPVAEAVEYIVQVLAALGYAHEHGVIHRDIKPANMMLTPQGVIKLMDFGIAKAATDRKLTMTGTTMGSLYYMSPEQIKGATSLDARSDLYSVGVSLYELVTGKRPFDGDSQFAIMAAHLEKAPVPPVTLDPRLPAELNDVILLSVGKDPAARFQTADAFRNALINVQHLVGRPATAARAAAISAAATMPNAAPMPTAPPQPAKQEFHLIEPTAPAKPGARRWLWVAAGAVFTALAVVAVIQFGPWKKTAASGSPQVEQTAPAPAPAQAPPAQAQTPATSSTTTPEPQPVPSPAPVQQQPPVAQQPSPAPVRTPARADNRKPAPAHQQPASPSQAPMPQPQPMSSPQQSAQQQAPPPAPSGPSPAEQAARRAELQQVREQAAMLGTRASSVKATFQTMQRSQAASGLGMRGDMTEAAALVNTYMDGVHSALQAGDVAAAKDFMQKAERQVEKLEKFLGR